MDQHGFLFWQIFVHFIQIRHSLVNHGMILSIFDCAFYSGRAGFSFSMESSKLTIMDGRMKIGLNQEWSTAGVAEFRSIRFKLAGRRQVVVPFCCLPSVGLTVQTTIEPATRGQVRLVVTILTTVGKRLPGYNPVPSYAVQTIPEHYK